MSYNKRHYDTLARHINWRDAIERQANKQPQHGSVRELTTFNQERAAKHGIEATGTITLQLRVENKGWQPLEFTCALHTYFAVDDIDTCSISGLKDKT